MKSSAKIPYSQHPFPGHHEPPAKPMQLTTPDLQQDKTPKMSMPSTNGLTLEQKCKTPSCSSAQSKVATISNNLWTRPKMDPVDDMTQLNPGAPTRGTQSLRGTLLVQKDTQAVQGISLNLNQENYVSVALSMPNSKPPAAEPTALHPVIPTSTITLMAAILEYLLLSQSCSPGSMASLLLPAGYRYWNHHQPTCQAQLVKSRTSYFRWTCNTGIWHGISSLTAMLKS